MWKHFFFCSAERERECADFSFFFCSLLSLEMCVPLNYLTAMELHSNHIFYTKRSLCARTLCTMDDFIQIYEQWTLKKSNWRFIVSHLRYIPLKRCALKRCDMMMPMNSTWPRRKRRRCHRRSIFLIFDNIKNRLHKLISPWFANILFL